MFAGREDDIERPDDAQWPEWSGYLRHAFVALRDDRHYGAMGGLGSIYYSAKSRYAQDHGIAGSAFEDFLKFIGAMDEEYIAIECEKQKADAERNKKT